MGISLLEVATDGDAFDTSCYQWICPTLQMGAFGMVAQQAADYEIMLTLAKENYYAVMHELGKFGLVGAGIGGRFLSTEELHIMKYDEAMAMLAKAEWKEAIEEEYQKMKDHSVFQLVKINDLPQDAKILTSTWAMKLKANGTKQARINAQGFEQINGVHYNDNLKVAPIVNDVTVRIVLVLTVMARMWAKLLDIKGAFLNGRFENGEKLYMKVIQGFERYFQPDIVLLLMRTIYGLTQAAILFWKELLRAFRSMNYQRSKEDPCLYIRWTKEGLVLWISCVDDCLVTGEKKEVKMAKEQMMARFDCDEIGELKEYVGCKVEYDTEQGSMRLMQPVMLQSFVDEFDLPKGQSPTTPVMPGTILVKGREHNWMNKMEQIKYQPGVGKLLHMMRWTRPDILNAVQDLSRYMSGAVKAHMVAMKRVMKYCVNTPKRGLLLKLSSEWDGNPAFEFEICGMADLEYAKDIKT